MNILAIDDNHDNLLTYKALLKTFLPEAVLACATSGREGIELAQSGNPDTILLDIQMPEMDGFETARLLKSGPLTSHIPIIMLTALKTDVKSRVKGLDSGADAFLAKPIDEVELVAQVKVMVRIKRSEDTLRKERDSLEEQVAKRMKEVNDKQRLNQLLLDAIPHYAYLINRERRIISLNAVAAREGAVLGDYCWCGIHKLSSITLEQKAYYLQNGEPLPGTKCAYCRADEAVDTQKTIHTKVEQYGKYWDAWWVPIDQDIQLHYLMDITERVKAEAAHKELEEQLHHAQRLESVGNLAGGIAHDFNNILTVISGYAYLMQLAAKGNDDMCSMAREISATSDRGASLTRSLLTFSRRQPVELSRQSLTSLVGDLKKTLERLIREDIALDIALDKNVLPVLVDRNQLDQVIINLVVNARDAMPEGGRISISTSLLKIDEDSTIQYGVESPGTYACVEVSDNGHGMDDSTKARIFEPFFTTKEVGKGTGLGLSMVFGIIKNHNGFINVFSEAGKGTVFSIYLPLTDPRQNEASIVAFEEPPRGNECILLAEDDSAILHMLKGLLEDYGYSVYSASDGAIAISLFLENKNSIDLVLTDVIMPQMNGREVYEKVKSTTPNIPVIFMSGYPADIINQEDMVGDSINYITKPVRPNVLLKKIRETLEITKILG